MNTARPLVFVLVLCNLVRAQERTPLRVGSIRIDRKEIFETEDSSAHNLFAVLVNKVHSTTNESIIRNELLFREGEVYDRLLIQESERNLRRMGIIGDIRIRTDSTLSAAADVVVETHEKWTMGLGLSYKQEGGVRSFSASAGEDNFLGNAQKVALDYNYRSNRSNPNGMEFRFREPRVFSSRWSSTLQYKNSEDLSIVTALLEHPFFSEDASWSSGIYADNGRVRRRLYRDGIQLSEEDVRVQGQSAWLVGSFGDQSKVRFGMGIRNSRSASSGVTAERTDNLTLISISAGYVQRSWKKEVFVNSLERVEDVPLGFACGIVAGKNIARVDARNTPYYVASAGTAALEATDTWSVSPRISYEAYDVEGGPNETTLEWGILGRSKYSQNKMLVANVRAVLGSSWSPGRQLTLGSPTGLRGYPSFEFSGERTLLFNVEHRWTTDLKWWIFRFGGAVFLDCGTAWNERDDFSRQRFHASTGLGLRIENIKQQGLGIIRIDLAFNADRRRVSELIITGSQSFDAFNNLEPPAPNPGR